MIKAEVIPHEGNDIPNWLDRCRDTIGQSRVLVVFVFIALIAIVVVALYRHHEADLSARQSPPTSYVPTGTSTLHVSPPTLSNLQETPVSVQTAQNPSSTTTAQPQTTSSNSSNLTSPIVNLQSNDQTSTSNEPDANNLGQAVTQVKQTVQQTGQTINSALPF